MIGTVLVAGTAFWLSRHIADTVVDASTVGLTIAKVKFAELMQRRRDRRDYAEAVDLSR